MNLLSPVLLQPLCKHVYLDTGVSAKTRHDGAKLSQLPTSTTTTYAEIVTSQAMLGVLPMDLLAHVGKATDLSLKMLHRAASKEESMNQARALNIALSSVCEAKTG